MRLRDLCRDRAVWLYGLLTAVFFYRPLTTQTFFFRDLYLLFYPKKLMLAEALRAGRLPLWDPFTHGGQPYLATASNTALHPSNLLYAILPPLLAFNVVLVLHVFFAAVAAYWAARSFRLSQPAAFVAGIAFAFCGVSLSTINLMPYILALPWFPMTIGLTHRALRDGRSLIPAAVAAAMPLYSGAAEPAAFLFLTLIVWVGATRRARIATAVLVIAAGIGLSLAFTLPATSVIEQSSRRAKQTYEAFVSWSVHPRRLPELVVPRFFGPTHTLSDADYWGSRSETDGFPYFLSLYFGVPVLLLAATGAVGKLGDAEVPRRALAIVAIVALALMLGRFLPGFRWIHEHVPLVATFRFPVKASLLAVFPIAILAGCGVERLAIRKWLPIALAGALLIAPLAIPAIARAFDFTPLATQHRTMLVWSLVHGAVATLALLAPRREAIAAVVAADLLVAGWSVNAYAPRELFDPPPLAEIARRAAGPLRLYAPPQQIVVRAPENHVRWLAASRLQSLESYAAATFGVPTIFHYDYDGLAPRNAVILGARLERLSWEAKRPWLDRAGVRVIVTRDDLRLPLVRPIAPGMYVNEAARPARFLGPCEGRVALTRKTLNDARYAVDAPCDGHVAFAENHYAGWRATVDGAEVPHVRADFAFTAIAVPKGRHEIERTYFPPRLIAGVVGTLLTLVALLVGEQLARRRKDA